MRVALVVDKELDDHKVRMMEAIKGAISTKYEVEIVPFDERFLDRIVKFDIAFNMATGGGRDSRQLHVPAVLDLLGIPYTTSSASTHAVCLDKSVTKAVLLKHGVGTANFFLIHPGEEVPERHGLRYPLIVKPVREGSSKGLRKDSVVTRFEDLEKAVKRIHEEFGESALVEEFIDGTEVTAGGLETPEGLRVFPIIEVDFSELPEGVERFYSYRVKNGEYESYVKYHIPARLSEEIWNTLTNVVRRVFRILNLRDYARMDIRIKDGNYYVLDVNSLPLLVPNYSDIIKMASADGMDYDELVLAILESAMRRYGLI